jgi:hypothetical protein
MSREQALQILVEFGVKAHVASRALTYAQASGLATESNPNQPYAVGFKAGKYFVAVG